MIFVKGHPPLGNQTFHFLTLIFWFLFSFGAVTGGKNEKKLLQYLFDKFRKDAHNVLERPVLNDTAPLIVSMKASLQQIIDVDERNQILLTNIWLNLKWRDYHFMWDPKDYGGISSINVPPTKVWRPDILMYNSADDKFDGTYPTNVVVFSNGNMQYVPPGMFKSTCDINITWFPFDEQICELKFGSWTYDGGSIDLKLQCPETTPLPPNCTEKGFGDTENFMVNGEWTLIEMKSIRNVEIYDCCNVPYIDIKFYIHIRRRALYYTFNFILPCLLISSIALLVFTLPPDAGEKISLGVTILLSLTMFLLLVADAMPQTSGAVPLIGMYFACIMIMCSLSVGFTVLVLNYHHRSSEAHPLPRWVKKVVCTWLAGILLMKHPVEESKKEPEDPFPAPTYPPPPSSPSVIMSTKANKNRRSRRQGCPDGPNIGDLDLTARASRSLLANVLDLDDDFRGVTFTTNSAGGFGGSPPAYSSCVTANSIPGAKHPVNDNFLPNSPPRQRHYQAVPHSDSFYVETGSAGGGRASDSAPGPSGGASNAASAPGTTGAEVGVQGIFGCSTRTELVAILRELRVITAKIRQDEEDNTTAIEWKFAARVIDRFCLVLFSIFTVVSTCAILFQAPNIFKS